MFSRRIAKSIILVLCLWLTVSPAFSRVHSMTDSYPYATSPYEIAEVSIEDVEDFELENGTRGERIVWNATADEPKNFTITRDGETYDSGDWFGGLLTLDLDHVYEENLTYSLNVTFTFVCTVFNEENESASDAVDVTFYPDERAPIIEEPDDFEYEEGSFGHEIRWNLTESNPDSYNITRQSNQETENFTVIESGDWDGDNITINVDGLNASYWYVFTLFANDTLGHNATSAVNVTVKPDLTNPELSSPADIQFEFGAKGNSISWFAYDSNPKNLSLTIYILYLNDTYGNTTSLNSPENFTAEWDFDKPKGDNITFTIDYLYLGNYTFELTVFDDFGRNASDSVNVTLFRDLRAPIVTTNDTFSYEEGYTGYTVVWSAEENNPTRYNLTLDGSVIVAGSWDGENITSDADGLAVGLHTFNLTLWDYFNQTTISLVDVTVTPDAHLPQVNQLQVLQAYSSPGMTNMSVQSYVWDLNGIESVTLEWGTDPSNPATKAMNQTSGDFYFASVGAYPVGTKVWYRVVATDNSTQNNAYATEWAVIEIRSMQSDRTPPLVWGGILALGILSTLVILILYFRTKTR
ncbi:hypothetical protein EU538_05140 [Candidatus Thorarchaeota archaeon]|nr:MAG: hypothetical protein EU538_05140 [Candidatus Thorarchaeota archaeon]